MALDPNIIMSGQQFDPAKDMNAAQNIQHNRAANKLLGMKTQAAQNEAKRNALVDQLSVKAANGDPNALQQITALDPQRGQAINKLHLQHKKQQVKDEFDALSAVKNSANPQKTYQELLPQLEKKYGDLNAPAHYDPAFVNEILNHAQTANDIIDHHIKEQDDAAKRAEFGVRESDKAKSRQETQRYHNAEIHNDQQRIQLAHQKAQREIAKQNNPEEKLKVASEIYSNMVGFQGPGPSQPSFTTFAQGLGLNPPQYKQQHSGGFLGMGGTNSLSQVPGTGYQSSGQSKTGKRPSGQRSGKRKSFSSANEVKAAYHDGKISKAQAQGILQSQFGYNK